jgi:hypothetical protein
VEVCGLLIIAEKVRKVKLLDQFTMNAGLGFHHTGIGANIAPAGAGFACMVTVQHSSPALMAVTLDSGCLPGKPTWWIKVGVRVYPLTS